MQIAPSQNSSYTILPGISEIAHKYDGYILDIWGLLHDGITPFPGVMDALKKLQALGKHTILLSNSPRRGHEVTKVLTDIGIPRNIYTDILTSGDATFIDLMNQVEHMGRKCYFFGHGMHEGILDDVQLTTVKNFVDADFILNAGPENLHLKLEDIKEKFKVALEHDLLMICANPDMKALHGSNEILCAGTLAKAYEDMGGRVHYHGKPHSFVYEIVLEKFKELNLTDTSKILCMGDSLHTDINGAHNMKLDGALVMSGLHGYELRIPEGTQPTPKDIDAMTLGYKTIANYYLPDLRW